MKTMLSIQRQMLIAHLFVSNFKPTYPWFVNQYKKLKAIRS